MDRSPSCFCLARRIRVDGTTYAIKAAPQPDDPVHVGFACAQCDAENVDTSPVGATDWVGRHTDATGHDRFTRAVVDDVLVARVALFGSAR